MIESRLEDLRQKNGKIIATIEKELTANSRAGIHAKWKAAETALFGVAQDGAEIDRFRAAIRHFRLPGCR